MLRDNVHIFSGMSATLVGSHMGHKVGMSLHIVGSIHIENQVTGKTRSCTVKDIVHKIAVKPWNVDTTFGRAGKFVNHPKIPHYPPKNKLK